MPPRRLTKRTAVKKAVNDSQEKASEPKGWKPAKSEEKVIKESVSSAKNQSETVDEQEIVQAEITQEDIEDEHDQEEVEDNDEEEENEEIEDGDDDEGDEEDNENIKEETETMEEMAEEISKVELKKDTDKLEIQPFPETASDFLFREIRQMYYAANSNSLQKEINKETHGPTVPGVFRDGQFKRHGRKQDKKTILKKANFKDKYARHIMDVIVQVYSNDNNKKANKNERKVDSHYCSSLVLSAKSAFFCQKIVEGRLLNQNHGNTKDGHYVILKMPRAFNQIMPKILHWLHGGKLSLMKSQIKLFMRSLSYFQIEVPRPAMQQLCDAIGCRWEDSKWKKGYKKEKVEENYEEKEEEEDDSSQNLEKDNETDDRPKLSKNTLVESEEFKSLKEATPFESVHACLPRGQYHALNVWNISAILKKNVKTRAEKEKDIPKIDGKKSSQQQNQSRNNNNNDSNKSRANMNSGIMNQRQQGREPSNQSFYRTQVQPQMQQPVQQMMVQTQPQPQNQPQVVMMAQPSHQPQPAYQQQPQQQGYYPQQQIMQAAPQQQQQMYAMPAHQTNGQMYAQPVGQVMSSHQTGYQPGVKREFSMMSSEYGKRMRM